MAPGPKKKRGQFHKTGQTSRPETTVSSADKVKDVEVDAENISEIKPSFRRTLDSNWNCYDEANTDDAVDCTVGKDFEVLLSYSSGAGSQLKLQEERDWDDQGPDKEMLMLDLKRLNKAFKCIPFHDLIDVPEDTFDSSQINRFKNYADESLDSFHSEYVAVVPRNSPEQDQGDYSLHSDQDLPELLPSASIDLSEKAKDLIQSLTLSTLSIKDESMLDMEKPSKTLETDDSKDDDNLDFLLSLSTKPEEKTKNVTMKTEGVDDWLSALLDD